MPVRDLDVEVVAQQGLPILCVDTCSILDVMRNPIRDDIQHHNLQASLDLLLLMEGDQGLVGLMAEQVHTEYSDHADGIETETSSALAKFCNSLTKVAGVAQLFGQGGQISHGQILGHPAAARAVADRWLDATHRVPTTDEAVNRAFKRVGQNRTPSTQGKQSIKDCVVIETYLRVVADLRAMGFTRKAVFLTTNKNDYEDPGRRAMLKADLDAEFQAIALDYAPNFSAAKHFLGL